MSYVSDLNNQNPTSQVNVLYDLKEAMKTAGYTVRGSGDGLAAHSAVGDIITSAGSGANGLNNNNAWFTVRQPATGSAPYSGTREWTFQRSTLPYSWFCEYSGPDATFDQTTGNATTRPTGTSPGQVQSFNNSGGANSILPTNTLFTYQIRVGDAAENFHWYAVAYPLGGGSCVGRIMFLPMASDSLATGEIEPYVMVAENDAFTTANFCRDDTTDFVGWLGKGGVVNTWTSVSAFFIVDNIGQAIMPDLMGANPNNGQDDAIPILWGRRGALANSGYKGISTKMKWPSTDRETGAVYESLTRFRIDDVVLEWDGATTPYI